MLIYIFLGFFKLYMVYISKKKYNILCIIEDMAQLYRKNGFYYREAEGFRENASSLFSKLLKIIKRKIKMFL